MFGGDDLNKIFRGNFNKARRDDTKVDDQLVLAVYKYSRAHTLKDTADRYGVTLSQVKQYRHLAKARGLLEDSIEQRY